MPQINAPIPITILAGQSNANNGVLGQALFSRVAESGGMIIHNAVNGSPLNSWIDGGTGDWSASGAAGSGELFAGLCRQIAAILDPSSPTHVPGAYLANVIWVQGEADTWSKNASASYEANLSDLHDALTARFGKHDLVISGLSDAPHRNHTFPDNNAANWDTVQGAQEALAKDSASISVVRPDAIARQHGFSDDEMFISDYIHYDPHSGFAAALGEALAYEAMPATFANAPQAAPQDGIQYRCGSNGSDTFTLLSSGVGQVFASWGYDTVLLADRAHGVKLLAIGPSNSRIVANGGPLVVIDLVSVEQVRLTNAADQARLGTGITSIETLAGDDRVQGSEFDETILLGDGYDIAQGGRGSDCLDGGGWVDALYGGRDDDSLFGGSANDTLGGANGNDLLDGGTGNDTLHGGSGADRFVFQPGDGHDRIEDFQDGTDLIALSGCDFSDLRIFNLRGEARIDFGEGSIVLAGVDRASLSVADFQFL